MPRANTNAALIRQLERKVEMLETCIETHRNGLDKIMEVSHTLMNIVKAHQERLIQRPCNCHLQPQQQPTQSSEQAEQ